MPKSGPKRNQTKRIIPNLPWLFPLPNGTQPRFFASFSFPNFIRMILFNAQLLSLPLTFSSSRSIRSICIFPHLILSILIWWSRLYADIAKINNTWNKNIVKKKIIVIKPKREGNKSKTKVQNPITWTVCFHLVSNIIMADHPQWDIWQIWQIRATIQFKLLIVNQVSKMN